jgi:hypothetical protein
MYIENMPKGSFVPPDFLFPKTFCIPNVLSHKTFCPSRCFFPLDVLSHGGYVSGRFFSVYFVWATVIQGKLHFPGLKMKVQGAVRRLALILWSAMPPFLLSTE